MSSPSTGPELRIDRPNSARIYDYFLGGKDNYVVDRVAADAVIAEAPGILVSVRANRDFMQRALRWVARQGVDQFLDIGTGIPTEPNLHQVVQGVDPTSRIVYVDRDPVVLAHAAALMAGDPRGRTAYVRADARDVDAILGAPELQETLDLRRPVCVSIIAVMHFIVDDAEARSMVGALVDAIPSGSYLVLTHGTADFVTAQMARGIKAYQQSGLGVRLRSRDELEALFEGTDLIMPGIVDTPEWRPDPDDRRFEPGEVSIYGAVARKP